MTQGKAKRLCGAQKKNAPGTCELAAGWGTPHTGFGHCKKHGGNTPSQIKAAEKEAAGEKVIVYGLPREVDPHTAMIEELHRTAGHVAYLQQIVADLESDDKLKQYQVGENGIVERPAVWIELYANERKHFAKVAKDCISVGIEERRVKMAEEVGQLVATIMRNFAEELGHDPTSKPVREAMGRHLRAV